MSRASLEKLNPEQLAKLLKLAKQRKAEKSSPSQEKSEIPILTRNHELDALPLSFTQRRLWFINQVGDIGTTYHIPGAFSLFGSLDLPALQAALNGLFARHESLRSVFYTDAGQPYVRLLPVNTPFPLTISEAIDTQHREEIIQREQQQLFDLSQGPLIRAHLIREQPSFSEQPSTHKKQLSGEQQRHTLILTVHHIISDGWSMSILLHELSTLYSAHYRSVAVTLPELTIQYPDYAAWQKEWLSGDRLNAQKNYWRQALADAPSLLQLPTDRPRPAQQSFQGDALSISLTPQLTQSLKLLSERHGCTLFMTLIGAWAAVLARISGQQDLLIGTPVANRGQRSIEPLVGFFANTLALRMDLTGNPDTAELLRRTRNITLAAQDHQDLPFEEIVEIINPPRSLSHTPVFQVIFSWQNKEETTLPSTFGNLDIATQSLACDTVKCDLELHLGEVGKVGKAGEVEKSIEGVLRYSTALFERDTLERYLGYLYAMLETMVAHPEQKIGYAELLASQERKLLLEVWNNPAVTPAPTRCLHKVFEHQAAATPQASALIFGEQTISYAELNQQANRLALRLIEQGVTPDTLVALCVERSPNIVVGILAILKAGGAYLPLDPSYSSERLSYILQDAAPRLIVLDSSSKAAFPAAQLQGLVQLYVDQQVEQEVDQKVEQEIDPAQNTSTDNPLVPALTPQHLAYVIYTSGSTGQPKGVMVEHAQVDRLFSSTEEEFGFTAEDTWCLFHSYGFDFAVWEMWGALRNGGKLVIVPHSVARSTPEFYRLVCEQRVTVLNQTPTAFNAFVQTHLHAPSHHALRYVIFGGEALDTASLCDWYQQHSDTHPQLINMYGITETTVHTTWHKVSATEVSQAKSIIGRALPDLRILLLNEDRQLVPIGSIGEIYVGGAGVARGYLRRDELTAERFIINPLTLGSVGSNERLYKSGDLARYLPDGTLEFLGRNDNQVKIRGFRIELGEVEARLNAHPKVRECLVVASDTATQQKQLVAYVAAGDDSELINELRAYLHNHLPDYMVPSAFVRLDAFPMTGNGKLDRKALPAADAQSLQRQSFSRPSGAREIALATIWQTLLGIEDIGRHDNFFSLGGHSLLAIQLLQHLQQAGYESEIRHLFNAPTLSEFASTLVEKSADEQTAATRLPKGERITPSHLPLIQLEQSDIDHIQVQLGSLWNDLQDIYALTPLQEGMLFHHLLAEQGDPYLVMSQTAFRERSQLDRYLDALRKVVARHDVLRSAFFWQGLSRPAQVVLTHVELSVTELELSPADGDISEQLCQRFDPQQRSMDLTRAPLMQFFVAYDAEHQRWLLLRLMHHLIDDVTSLSILNEELLAFYLEQGDQLPEPVAYRQLVAHIQETAKQHDYQAFFTAMLGDITEPTLPFGVADIQQAGAEIREHHTLLPDTLNQQLRELARREGVSLASLCHLAWGQVLALTSGQEQVVCATVLFGRMSVGAGADRAMGLFINTLPLRFDMDHTSVRDNVQRIHQRLAQLLEMEHAPLSVAQRCSGLESQVPLFSALINYRHNQSLTLDEQQLTALDGIEMLSSEERSNYPFALSVEDLGHSLGLTMQVALPHSAELMCGYMHQALESLAQALLTAPEQESRTLEILSPAVRHHLLTDVNQTQTPIHHAVAIHRVFEQQVKRTPLAPAIGYQDESLSYQELNQRANRLAHQLIASGVVPETRVAICMSRSTTLIVAILAVLKAGGAYLPLDPKQPAQRLSSIIQDAQPRLMLADAEGRAALAQNIDEQLLCLDPHHYIDSGSTQNPILEGDDLRRLAYVIYTSGSTGQPKGVMVEHGNLLNLHHALSERVYPIAKGPLRISLNANIAFDASLQGILSLLSGHCVVLIDQSLRTDSHALVKFIAEQGLDILDCTPTQLELLLAAGFESLPQPPTLLIGGEAISSQTWQRLAHHPAIQAFNLYGPTECTVDATLQEITTQHAHPNIGRPLANVRLYLLDALQRPVPQGAIGEIYIGGNGVARGYLNRPEMNEQRFIPDPYHQSAATRMYRTGDLARYLPDGALEFMGRNDQQVKIRGYRIELGEIETILLTHPAITEAKIIARQQQLIAYFKYKYEDGACGIENEELRRYLQDRLPEYMIPIAYIQVEEFAVTPNGKLDLNKLPQPRDSAYISREYQAPQGASEEVLARYWSELLGIEQIGRTDNFFELGGHSLLAVQLVEHLRRHDLTLSVSNIFHHPTLAAQASALSMQHALRVVDNAIDASSDTITPDMLPLIKLTQTDIDKIITQIPGGKQNIQDIYSLTPLQDGILFHHMYSSEGDAYLYSAQMSFNSRTQLDSFLVALQQVVDRHDILRTAFVWEGISQPAQVVLKTAKLEIIELPPLPVGEQVSTYLHQQFDSHHYRIDLTQAPLLQLAYSQDAQGRWLLHQVLHHLVSDHVTLGLIHAEISALMRNHSELPPALPFRNLVAHTLFSVTHEQHRDFFTDMLGDTATPTLAYDLNEVHHSPGGIDEYHVMLDETLSRALRHHASQLGISVASLFHLAWAQVLARLTGQQQVVFGTVLLGRMHASSSNGHAMGLFINTLPLKIRLNQYSAVELAQHTNQLLIKLMDYEHASLAMAQQCSGLPSGTPLFNSLLNYRHNSDQSQEGMALPDGIQFHSAEERTNYPLNIAVEDYGQRIGLTLQVTKPLEAQRLSGYLQCALQSLSQALQAHDPVPVSMLDVLPADERQQQLVTLNQTQQPYNINACFHERFEQQVKLHPQRIALRSATGTLSYQHLNQRANCLAHRLIACGVGPDKRVLLCVSRDLHLVVALLAIAKAGGAYVPLDPTHPRDRLLAIIEDAKGQLEDAKAHIEDAKPQLAILDSEGIKALGEETVAGLEVIDPSQELENFPDDNPQKIALKPHHLAYVIYTSGSTGKPKGVMVEHRNVVNFLSSMQDILQPDSNSRWLALTTIAFDIAVLELYLPLSIGACTYLVDKDTAQDPYALANVIEHEDIDVVQATPASWQALLMSGWKGKASLTALCGGEAMPSKLAEQLNGCVQQLWNLYGPTETAVWSTCRQIDRLNHPRVHGSRVHESIGRPIGNTHLYILDEYLRPVPFGVAGELYIGGAGVARGYLNLPALTQERFIADPFSDAGNARLYKTGDLVRYLHDGELEYIGRNDFQIKLRGFRIELGEIESCLTALPEIREAVIVPQSSVSGDVRLIAYLVADDSPQLFDNVRMSLMQKLPDYMVPAAFVRLDGFPLTPNGKLDRRSLPVADDASLVEPEYEAPESELEQFVAHLWSELLGIAQVSRNAHFFELGGHSLLAVRMVMRLKTAGWPAEVYQVFQTPNLKQLCQLLTDQIDTQHPAIIPIRQEGAHPPLFILPDGAGEIAYAFLLAQTLPTGTPIYALPWRFDSQDGSPCLDKIAHQLAHNLVQVQSQGPYRILAHSAGGTLSYALACKLQQQGHEVSFVGLIDAPMMGNQHLRPRNISQLMLADASRLNAELTPEQLALFVKLEESLKGSLEEDLENSLENSSAQVTWQHLTGAQLLPYSDDSERDWDKWHQRQYFEQAVHHYTPPACKLPLFQFRAQQTLDQLRQPEEAGRWPAAYATTGGGWESIVGTDCLHIEVLPGDHFSILSETEYRSMLAERLVHTLSLHQKGQESIAT